MKKRGKHPIFRAKLSLGQKAADKLSAFAGSWSFIIGFIIFLLLWMFLNGYIWMRYINNEPFDPYPFILLNLVLSCLAAIQAPIILMSQNRQAERDRRRTEYDYQVDKKAEKEVEEIKKELEEIKRLLKSKI